MFGVVDVIADLDFARFGDGTPTLEPVYLVLFEQKFNAAGVLRDGVRLISQHLFPID